MTKTAIVGFIGLRFTSQSKRPEACLCVVLLCLDTSVGQLLQSGLARAHH